MRKIRAAVIVIGFLTGVPAVSLAAPATNSAVHATKGVVRFVDAHKLVIARSPHHGRQLTFVLNPSTERVGDVTVGSTVDIRYRREAKQQVATAVTVVRVKQQPSVPGHISKEKVKS
jgi:hypothetical protein